MWIFLTFIMAFLALILLLIKQLINIQIFATLLIALFSLLAIMNMDRLKYLDILHQNKRSLQRKREHLSVFAKIISESIDLLGWTLHDDVNLLTENLTKYEINYDVDFHLLNEEILEQSADITFIAIKYNTYIENHLKKIQPQNHDSQTKLIPDTEKQILQEEYIKDMMMKMDTWYRKVTQAIIFIQVNLEQYEKPTFKLYNFLSPHTNIKKLEQLRVKESKDFEAIRKQSLSKS